MKIRVFARCLALVACGITFLLWSPEERSEAAPGDACVEGYTGSQYDWSEYDEIVIYLHQDLAENLEHSNGDKWTNTEVRRAVEALVLSFQESLAVGIPRIRVASGYSNADWDDLLGGGTVHISAVLASSCGSAAETDVTTGGARISLRRSGPGYIDGINQGWTDCNWWWKHYRTTDYVFRGVLNHELMHLFGGKHPITGHEQCDTVLSCAAPATSCSCCAELLPNVGENWNCYKHDQTRLRDAGHGTWGSVDVDERHLESFNATNWWDLSSPPWHAPWPGLSSNHNAAYLFMARRRPDYTNTYTQLYRWVYTTQAWEYWGYVDGTTLSSLGPVDVAYGGSPAYPYVGSTSVASASDALRDIYFTKKPGPKTRYRYTVGTNLTPIGGVGIAYHDGTLYDRYILVWRDDELGINLTTVTSSGVVGATYELVDDEDTRQIAAEAPSIECAPQSTFNPRPCVVVWAAPMGEGATTYQKLKWTHIGIGFGGALDATSPIMEQGIGLYGPPHVTYNASGPSNSRFLLSFRNDYQEYFATVGKSTSETAYWDVSTWKYHYAGDETFSLSPAVGAAGGAYEVIEQVR